MPILYNGIRNKSRCLLRISMYFYRFVKGVLKMYEIFEQLLKKRKITPYRVSKETGVPQSTLSDWKRGRISRSAVRTRLSPPKKIAEKWLNKAVFQLLFFYKHLLFKFNLVYFSQSVVSQIISQISALIPRGKNQGRIFLRYFQKSIDNVSIKIYNIIVVKR